MLNIFKNQSPKRVSPKNETHNPNENILIKQFDGLNIEIYGTYEEPLFKAKDIGDLLDIKDIKSTLRDFDTNEKGVHIMHTPGGIQETNMLTEQGLYKILFISRKSIAKQFQKWVYEVIKEIRLKGKYDLEEKLREKEQAELELKQKELEYQKQLEETKLELQRYKEKTYEEIEKTGHIYVIKTDGGIKVGKTKDAVVKRIKGMQTGNVNNIEILLDYPTSNVDLLEKNIHYILDRYRCNSNREFFDCDIDYIKMVTTICGKAIDTLKSSFQHITQDELLTKLAESGLKINTNNTEDKSETTEENYSDDEEQNDFYNWLDQNIEKRHNSVLRLKTICELYINRENIHSSLSNKYRLEVERYITIKYKDVDYKYRDSSYNGERFKGWVGLQLKNAY